MNYDNIKGIVVKILLKNNKSPTINTNYYLLTKSNH